MRAGRHSRELERAAIVGLGGQRQALDDYEHLGEGASCPGVDDMAGNNTGILAGGNGGNCFEGDKKRARDKRRRASKESADRIVIGPTFVFWQEARILPQAHIR